MMQSGQDSAKSYLSIEAPFKETIGKRYEGKIAIESAFQELNKLPAGFGVPPQRQKPWGTGHAVLCARDVIREPFAVINADDFYGYDGYQLLAGYLSRAEDGVKAAYCMCGFMLRNTLSDNGTVSRGRTVSNKRCKPSGHGDQNDA